MWNNINKFGLSDDEIDKIAKDLIEKEKSAEKKNCPDCGMEVGEHHFEGCDVARCTKCGCQRIGCDCKGGKPDVWTGIWPGTLEALEQKLICCWDDTKEWTADLNELARRRF